MALHKVEGGMSSGFWLRRRWTPVSKSTRTPSRSQYILYLDVEEEDAVTVEEDDRKKVSSCFCFLVELLLLLLMALFMVEADLLVRKAMDSIDDADDTMATEERREDINPGTHLIIKCCMAQKK